MCLSVRSNQALVDWSRGFADCLEITVTTDFAVLECAFNPIVEFLFNVFIILLPFIYDVVPNTLGELAINGQEGKALFFGQIEGATY